MALLKEDFQELSVRQRSHKKNHCVQVLGTCTGRVSGRSLAQPYPSHIHQALALL